MVKSIHFKRQYWFTVAVILVLLVTNLPVYAQGSDDFPEQHGNRLFIEDFTTLVNRWDRLQTAKYSADYKDFGFQFDIRSPGFPVWSLPRTTFDLDRYYIDVNAAIMPDSAPDSFVGVTLNYQNEDNFYVFGVSPSGTFEVRAWDDGAWADDPLIEGEFEITDTIRLQIEDNQGIFVVGINGERLASFENNDLSGGHFGLFAQAGRGILQVSFDDYSVYDIGVDS